MEERVVMLTRLQSLVTQSEILAKTQLDLPFIS